MMVDIQQQILYWKSGAEEDISVAAELIASRRFRHGLFFAHLALEKILKAHICKKTRSLPPRIHNLSRLSQIADLVISEDQRDHLADMNEFNLEGRYPVQHIELPSEGQALNYMNKSKEAFEWLQQQL